jgi:adenylyltransferase/sulfurtransferase
VLIVGAGGLGSPLALYLAAAGVGTLGIVDFDVVDASNLQRQLLYGTSSVGRPKVEAAIERIHDLNPLVTVEPHPVRLSRENALEIIGRYEVVVDGTDNFATRYLVNDASILLGIPNVYGSIYRFEGQVSVFFREKGPCYRCIFPTPPPPGAVPSCAEAGVLGVLPGLVGTLQATEVLKLLLSQGEPLIGRLLLIDSLRMQFETVELFRNPDCPLCGSRPTQTTLIDYEQFCGLDKPNSSPSEEVTPEQLQAWLKSPSAPALLDVREPHEWEINRISGARHAPLSSLENHLTELSYDAEIVTYCYKGTRSLKALRRLQALGYNRVKSLKGGIDAWAERIEPGMPRY